MVQTSTGNKKIFRKVDQINIADMNNQAQVYFGLIGIGNLNTPLPNPLGISYLKILDNNRKKVKNLYDRVCLYTNFKAIEGSIAKTSLLKLGLNKREYERYDAGGIIRNDGPNIIYLLLKTIKPDIRISV